MFANILLPTDFSECSVLAAKTARRFAEGFGSRVSVLHVLDEPAALDPMFRGDVPLEIFRERLDRYARENLASFLAAHFPGMPISDTMLASGIPYREIVRRAREADADLIVIGTHGRTGVEHAIFGSTAEKVVRLAPCPVLSVRCGWKEFVFP